jgi:hypothetical protein
MVRRLRCSGPRAALSNTLGGALALLSEPDWGRRHYLAPSVFKRGFRDALLVEFALSWPDKNRFLRSL